MSGLMDFSALTDAMINGVFVSSVLKVVINRSSLSSVFSQENLWKGAQIGTAQHIWNQAGRGVVKSVTDRVGL